MLSLLVLACAAPSPLVGQARTDDGGWDVALDTDTYDEGRAPVRLTVSPARDGLGATGLTVLVRPGMSDMSHLDAVVYLEEQDAGVYAGELQLDMTGLWTLAGYVRDDTHAESYALMVEVLP